MTTITLELPSTIYQRLSEESNHKGQSIEEIAQACLVKQKLSPVTEREQIREILCKAGLLTELAPTLKERATNSKATLEEVQNAFARAGGKSLSDMIIEMRGPKI